VTLLHRILCTFMVKPGLSLCPSQQLNLAERPHHLLSDTIVGKDVPLRLSLYSMNGLLQLLSLMTLTLS